MPVVMVEGGYRNVTEVYMAPTRSMDMAVEAGLPVDNWTLFDEDGRKCVCAFDRSTLYFWAMERDILIVTRQ